MSVPLLFVRPLVFRRSDFRGGLIFILGPAAGGFLLLRFLAAERLISIKKTRFWRGYSVGKCIFFKGIRYSAAKNSKKIPPAAGSCAYREDYPKILRGRRNVSILAAGAGRIVLSHS